MPSKEQAVAQWRADFERHFEAKYAGRKVLKTARHVIGYAVDKYARKPLTDEDAYDKWQSNRAAFVSWARRRHKPTTWENCVEWCATVAIW